MWYNHFWCVTKAFREEVSMGVEELKARLRALLHQRDMLRYERDSLELYDLLDEIDREIEELHQKLRMTA